MGGHQLYQTLKERHPQLHVLFMSGYAEEIAAHGDLLVSGNADFLPKPFTVEALTQKVRAILDKRGDDGGEPGDPAHMNDVDDGSTTLLSPVFTVADAISANLSYWRWYTNDAGNNPGEDPWSVIVSDDADLDDALPLLAKGGLYHAGQVCVSVQRV